MPWRRRCPRSCCRVLPGRPRADGSRASRRALSSNAAIQLYDRPATAIKCPWSNYLPTDFVRPSPAPSRKTANRGGRQVEAVERLRARRQLRLDQEIDDILKDDTYQIVVVMFGANDNQADQERQGIHRARHRRLGRPLRPAGRRRSLRQELRAKGPADCWTGLPIMRSPDDSDDAEELNDIYREKSFINGAKSSIVDKGSPTSSGRYSAPSAPTCRPDTPAARRTAMHFTPRCVIELAHFAEKEIRRDLSLGKLERNIPLAATRTSRQGHGPRGEPGRAGAAVRRDNPKPGGGASRARPSSPARRPSARRGAGRRRRSRGARCPAAQQSKVGEVDVIRPRDPADVRLRRTEHRPPPGAAASLADAESASDLPGRADRARLDLGGQRSVGGLIEAAPAACRKRPDHRVLMRVLLPIGPMRRAAVPSQSWTRSA